MQKLWMLPLFAAAATITSATVEIRAAEQDPGNLLAHAISNNPDDYDKGEPFYNVWQLHMKDGDEDNANYHYSCFSYVTFYNQYNTKVLYNGKETQIHGQNVLQEFSEGKPIVVLDYDERGAGTPDMAYSTAINVPEDGNYLFSAVVDILECPKSYTTANSKSELQKISHMAIVAEPKLTKRNIKSVNGHIEITDADTNAPITFASQMVYYSVSKSGQKIELTIPLTKEDKYLTLYFPVSAWILTDLSLVNTDIYTGVDVAPAAEGAADTYYDLQGNAYNGDPRQASPGLYIVREGASVRKIAIR